MAFFASRVEDVIIALRKLRKGETLTAERTSDIAWLERTLDLKRPLTSYSDRSQRRIFQRLREGATSSNDIYRRDYKARQTSKQTSRAIHGLTPAQWKHIEPLRDKLSSYGMDVEPYMDDEVLKDFAQMYGYQYLYTVLTQQVDSTEQYIAGNLAPGNARWNARGELESRFGASSHVMYIRGTNPYYYYHGRRS